MANNIFKRLEQLEKILSSRKEIKMVRIEKTDPNHNMVFISGKEYQVKKSVNTLDFIKEKLERLGLVLGDSSIIVVRKLITN